MNTTNDAKMIAGDKDLKTLKKARKVVSYELKKTIQEQEKLKRAFSASPSGIAEIVADVLVEDLHQLWHDLDDLIKRVEGNHHDDETP